MNKKIKKISFIFFLFFLFQTSVNAASVSIWASASNVTKGKTVTISVNTKDVGGVFNITSSNNAVLAGGVTGEWLDENKTYTYTFTAKSTGSATITITPVDASTTEVGNETAYTSSKSVALKVVEKSSSGGGSSGSGGTISNKKEYSTNNNLSSLGIEGYELEQKFDKDTTEYKLTVDQSVEKIKINASPEDKKASVSGTGEINISPGENNIEVKVTAENGNEKKYKIIVLVEDLNPIKVMLDKEEYTVVRKNNDLIEKLEYYEETTVKIDEQDIIAYTNQTTKITLVLLKDKENIINYYIYDAKNNQYQKYEYIKINNITLQLLSTKEEIDNYKKYTTTIGEQKVDIYRLNKKNKIGLIYGKNIATGNEGFYQYDEEEQTLSRYYNDEINIYKTETKKNEKYLVIAICIYSLTLIITIICSIIKNKKQRAKKRY